MHVLIGAVVLRTCSKGLGEMTASIETFSNINPAQPVLEHRKRISCVTCSAPLPIRPDGEVEEPEYFACTSNGWTSENEGNREVEDLSTLNMHTKTVTEALWDVFNQMALGAREDLAHINLGIVGERHSCLEQVRSLCGLLEDLQEEASRKARRLCTWVQREIEIIEQKI